MANLFSDGFEGGNLTAWSASQTDGGNLSAAAGAKLHGNYGLSALINDQNSIFVRDNTPNTEKRYRCRFYLDLNSLTMADTKTFNVFLGKDTGDGSCFWIWVEKSGSNRRLHVMDKSDGAYNRGVFNFILTDEPHCVEVDWKASSAPGADNGFIELWIDGAFVATATGIDSDTEEISTVVLGAESIGTDISGTIYIDDFASNNDGNQIGTLGAVPSPIIPFTGMGICMFSSADTNVFDRHLDNLLRVGITNLRVDIPNWNDTVGLARSKAAVLRAIARGANITWGVSFNHAGNPISTTNWPDFRAGILSAAAWAQANGVYEFQLGNEEELHVDGTTLAVADIITNLKGVATDVQAIFTRGNVSYTCAMGNISDWVSADKGDIDLIAANIYMGYYGGTPWTMLVDNLVTKFGVGGCYITEFNLSATSIDTYSTDEVQQEAQLSVMIEYFRTKGITRINYFNYYDGALGNGPAGFGALKTDATYRALWDLIWIKRSMAGFSLNSAEHDWYAVRSGLANNASLNDHKYAYFVSKGVGGAGKPLSQMENEWLSGVSGVNSDYPFELWSGACAAQSVTVGKSINECKFNFFTGVASRTNP